MRSPRHGRPSISVLLSTFNGAAFIRQSVTSVLEQDFEDFEFLIVDDASGDSTPTILTEFTDPRVDFTCNQANLGLFENLNLLVQRSRGALVKLWSQDDIMHPNCLEAGWRFWKRHPELGCFWADCDFLHPDGVHPPGPDSTP